MLSNSKNVQEFLTSGSTLELPSMKTQATSFCNNYEQDSISGLQLRSCLPKRLTKNYNSSNSLFRENNSTEYFETTEYPPFKDDAKTEYFDPIGFSIQEDIVAQDVKPIEVQIKPTEVHIQPATEVQVEIAGVNIEPVDLIEDVDLAEEQVDLSEQQIKPTEVHIQPATEVQVEIAGVNIEPVDLIEDVDLAEEQVDLSEQQIKPTEVHIQPATEVQVEIAGVNIEPVDLIEDVDLAEEQVDLSEQQIKPTEVHIQPATEVQVEIAGVNIEPVDLIEDVDLAEEQVDLSEQQIKPTEVHIQPATEVQVEIAGVNIEPVDLIEDVDLAEEQVDLSEQQIKPTEVHIQPATEVQVEIAGVNIEPVDLIEDVDLAEEQVDLSEQQIKPTEVHIQPATEVQVEIAGVNIEPVDLIEDVDLAEEQVDLSEQQIINEHFELAQGSRGSLPEAELDRHGRVIELRSAQPNEFDRSKFIKLSNETFFDLRGPPLELLSDLCRAIHRAQEFFLSVATNQWVRTSIASSRPSQDLFSPTSIVEERSKLISSITFHSVVLPHDPFWTRAQAVGNGVNKLRVHFPCNLLKEALQQGTTLMEKLLEWRKKREECEIGLHGMKRSADGNSIENPLRLFWEIQADHVKPLKEFAKGSYGTIWLVTWRGGIFVRKDRISTSNQMKKADPRDATDTELNVVEKLSHPHIVYSFGVSYAVNKSSLFMEYMQNDLYHCIADRVRTTGDNEPPFSHPDSVNILLQFAKAMAYMHTQNVVHGDLKSHNILVSKVLITEGENHYVVKVADFGSAQVVSPDSGSTGFIPGPASTKYAAPEVLKIRSDKNVVISLPEKIDVYSFGIVAFEVITGEEPYMDVKSKKVTKGVIDSTLRPPLRAKCQKEKFLHDERLISLVESCWSGDPLERPSFLKVLEVLNDIRIQILVRRIGKSKSRFSTIW